MFAHPFVHLPQVVPEEKQYHNAGQKSGMSRQLGVVADLQFTRLLDYLKSLLPIWWPEKATNIKCQFAKNCCIRGLQHYIYNIQHS